jgi:hypothetical protein
LKKVEPDNFLVKYGGYGRISWQVRWEGGQVVWRRFAPEWTEVSSEQVQPEPQQWIDFWQALDESRIWDWNEVYYRSADRARDPKDEEPVETDDVVSWSVEILLKDGRLVDSSGSNAVPGETRLSRRGRGRGRGRSESPPAKKSPVQKPATQKPAATSAVEPAGEDSTATSDPSEEIQRVDNNSGIPVDTFDRFLNALRTLLGGREFADDEIGAAPESLPTQYRTRTIERTDRPDPFAEEVKQAKPQRSSTRRSGGQKGGSRKKVPGGRTRPGTSSRSTAEGGTSTRKRSRRGRKPSGEIAESTATTTGDPADPKKRRRRRRRKPASGEQGSDQRGPNPSGDSRPASSSGSSQTGAAGDGTQKKRRRRRRRRKPGGAESSGSGSGAPPGNSSSG